MPSRVTPVVFLHALSVALLAQAPSTVQVKDIQIPKLSSRPQLEQFLSGASRLDMKRIDDFRQRQPGDGVPASRKTIAWVGYDDTNFYAVFVCESPPGQTRARIAKREDVFSDDIVGVVLDTYHDHQRGYEFFANPYGVQADATESEGSSDDFSFDTLWYSEGRLIPEGFAVMLTIPFKSLRFARTPVQTWGIALFRSIPTNNEQSFWPYVTQKVSASTSNSGTRPASKPSRPDAICSSSRTPRSPARISSTIPPPARLRFAAGTSFAPASTRRPFCTIRSPSMWPSIPISVRWSRMIPRSP